MKNKKLIATMAAMVMAFSSMSCVMGVSAVDLDEQDVTDAVTPSTDFDPADFEILESFGNDTWAHDAGKHRWVEGVMGKDEVYIQSYYSLSYGFPGDHLLNYHSMPDCYAKATACKVVNEEKAAQLKEWYRNYDQVATGIELEYASVPQREGYIWFYDDDGELVIIRVPLDSEIDIFTGRYPHNRIDKDCPAWTLIDELNSYLDGLDEAIAAQCQLGDVNMDGTLDTRDVIKLAAQLKSEEQLYKPALADMNDDGKVDVRDLTMLAAKVKGV